MGTDPLHSSCLLLTMLRNLSAEFSIDWSLQVEVGRKNESMASLMQVWFNSKLMASDSTFRHAGIPNVSFPWLLHYLCHTLFSSVLFFTEFTVLACLSLTVPYHMTQLDSPFPRRTVVSVKVMFQDSQPVLISSHNFAVCIVQFTVCDCTLF